MNSPQIQQGQWIKIGTSRLDGLVLDLHSDGSLGVGYCQNGTKAIKEDVIWNGEMWEFQNSGPAGSYLHGAEAAMVKRGPSQST